MITFLKSLFSSERRFSSYTECPEVFYRFNGRGEHGPKKLDVAIGYTGINETDVVEYRFADERHWKPRSYFLTLWTKMPASEFSRKRLQKEGIPFEDSISEPSARQLLRDNQKTKPITPTQKKRLLECGVSVDAVKNRDEAKEIIKREESKQGIKSDQEAARQQRVLDQPEIEACHREIETLTVRIGTIVNGWTPKFPQQLDELQNYRDLLNEALDYVTALSLDSLMGDPFYDPKSGNDYYLEYEEAPSEAQLTAFKKGIFLGYLKSEGDDFSHITILRNTMPTIRASKL